MAGVPDVFWSAMRATSGMMGGRWGRDLCLWRAARSPSSSGGRAEMKGTGSVLRLSGLKTVQFHNYMDPAGLHYVEKEQLYFQPLTPKREDNAFIQFP